MLTTSQIVDTDDRETEIGGERERQRKAERGEDGL